MAQDNQYHNSDTPYAAYFPGVSPQPSSEHIA